MVDEKKEKLIEPDTPIFINLDLDDGELPADFFDSVEKDPTAEVPRELSSVADEVVRQTADTLAATPNWEDETIKIKRPTVELPDDLADGYDEIADLSLGNIDQRLQELRSSKEPRRRMLFQDKTNQLWTVSRVGDNQYAITEFDPNGLPTPQNLTGEQLLDRAQYYLFLESRDAASARWQETKGRIESVFSNTTEWKINQMLLQDGKVPQYLQDIDTAEVGPIKSLSSPVDTIITIRKNGAEGYQMQIGDLLSYFYITYPAEAAGLPFRDWAVEKYGSEQLPTGQVPFDTEGNRQGFEVIEGGYRFTYPDGQTIDAVINSDPQIPLYVGRTKDGDPDKFRIIDIEPAPGPEDTLSEDKTIVIFRQRTGATERTVMSVDRLREELNYPENFKRSGHTKTTDDPTDGRARLAHAAMPPSGDLASQRTLVAGARGNQADHEKQSAGNEELKRQLRKRHGVGDGDEDQTLGKRLHPGELVSDAPPIAVEPEVVNPVDNSPAAPVSEAVAPVKDGARRNGATADLFGSGAAVPEPPAPPAPTSVTDDSDIPVFSKETLESPGFPYSSIVVPITPNPDELFWKPRSALEAEPPLTINTDNPAEAAPSATAPPVVTAPPVAETPKAPSKATLVSRVKEQLGRLRKFMSGNGDNSGEAAKLSDGRFQPPDLKVAVEAEAAETATKE